MVGAGAYTLALFTDSAANAGNAFVVGTVAIGVSPASALITLTGMLPGDSTTGTLTVSSTGNSTLRYAISTAATNPDGKALRDQMALVIKTKDTDRNKVMALFLPPLDEYVLLRYGARPVAPPRHPRWRNRQRPRSGH